MLQDVNLTTRLIQFIISGQLYPEEELKEIDNTDGKYYISSYGRVLSVCGNPLLLKPFMRNGYNSVKIDGRNYYVHRLVVQHFISRCIIKKDYLEVHHKDGDRTNNRVNNLQILTKKQHRTIHNSKEVINNES